MKDSLTDWLDRFIGPPFSILVAKIGVIPFCVFVVVFVADTMLSSALIRRFYGSQTLYFHPRWYKRDVYERAKAEAFQSFPLKKLAGGCRLILVSLLLYSVFAMNVY